MAPAQTRMTSRINSGMDGRDASQPKSLDWDGIYEDAVNYFFRSLNQRCPTKESLDTAITQTIMTLSSIREFACYDPGDFFKVWSSLSEADGLTDALLYTVLDLSTVLPERYGVEIKQLASIAAERQDVIHKSIISHNCFVPPAIKEGYMDGSQQYSIYANNLWFFTLVLMRRSGKLNLHGAS